MDYSSYMMAVDNRGSSHWLLLDSGASDHMVWDRKWLSDMKNVSSRSIILRNGATVTGNRSGSMLLDATLMHNG